jgi:photosystem II stability/assembly factor-like uncharacterized protein
LYDVDMVNENEGWAVGGEGGIIYYTAGGWREAESPTQGVLSAIDMVNENEGWAVGFAGKILHYQSGQWKLIEPIVDKDLSEIEMINENEGWILAGDETLLRYRDGSWEETSVPQQYIPFTAMDMISSEEEWLMSTRHILHLQNGEWKVFDNPARRGMAKMLMLNENEGWAVGEGILHYTNK